MNIKEITKISLILGAILGAVALIPFVVFLAFLFLFLFASVSVAIYKKDFLPGLDYRQTVFWGMFTGATASIGFFTIFIPITLILSFIFNGYLSYGLTYLIKFDALWFSIIILLVVMLVCASSNAISLMITKSIKDINWKEFVEK